MQNDNPGDFSTGTDIPPTPPSEGQVSSAFVSNPKKKGVNKKVLGVVIGIFFLLAGTVAGVFLVGQQQDIREKAGGGLTNTCKLCLQNAEDADECYPSPCLGHDSGGGVIPRPPGQKPKDDKVDTTQKGAVGTKCSTSSDCSGNSICSVDKCFACPSGASVKNGGCFNAAGIPMCGNPGQKVGDCNVPANTSGSQNCFLPSNSADTWCCSGLYDSDSKTCVSGTTSGGTSSTSQTQSGGGGGGGGGGGSKTPTTAPTAAPGTTVAPTNTPAPTNTGSGSGNQTSSPSPTQAGQSTPPPVPSTGTGWVTIATTLLGIIVVIGSVFLAL